MARKGSVAPKERINIVYRPATSAHEIIELPLKMLVLADLTGKHDVRSIEERKPIEVDKDNFKDVMKGFDLGVDVSVKDRLAEDSAQEIAAQLKFKGLKDFTPEGIVKQVPELNRLLELRKALSALKSPLGNRKDFRERIRELLDDESSRQKLLEELGLSPQGAS
jgi:type VI secretion system protein ImpB